MRFEPQDLEPLFTQRGLSRDTRPGRALWRQLVWREDPAAIAAVFGVDLESVERYLRTAWGQFIPKGRRERERFQVQFIQAATFTLTPGTLPDPDAEDEGQDAGWLFRYIVHACRAERFVYGSVPAEWNRDELLPDPGPVFVTRAQLKTLGLRG